MKKLLTLTLFSTLVACSQNPDNLTLSCYGAVIKTEAKQEFVTPQVSRTYKFHNYKIDNYECAQQANIISCNFVKEEMAPDSVNASFTIQVHSHSQKLMLFGLLAKR